ncbi:MAG: S9 family peptidase [Bacteroidales bacterium]|nr:S9 family peptidase [Bacteroidales bacterium]
MKKFMLYSVLIGLISVSCDQKNERPNYPVTMKGDVVDTYFGTEVTDPYRWLEDDNSAETEAWVNAQNELTFGYLDKIPFRDGIKNRLKEIWDYPKYGLPYQRGNYWYFSKNDGLQQQAVVYQMDALDGEPRVFLDPNTLSEDGTVALSGLTFSKDGKYAAYSVSSGGSDWREIFVIDVEMGQKLNDHLEWIKFSGMSWLGNGFFYSRFNAPEEGDELKGVNKNNQVFYHVIGTNQDQDELIYEDPENPLYMWTVATTEDESFIVLMGSTPNTRGNSLYYKKANDKEAAFIPIEESYDFQTYIIDNVGSTLFVMTNKEAPKNKLFALNSQDKNQAQREILAEADDVLNSVSIIGGKIVANYMHDAASQAFVFNLYGEQLNQIDFPTLGSASDFVGSKESSIAFYSFTSFTYPNLIFKYNIETNQSEIFRDAEINFDFKDYKTEQIFYTSKDGTQVPMFITYKKDLVLDGSNPTLLYGYGGFNISLTPWFSAANLVFLENGGIYAVPNLRGGGEYGEDWHQAGTQLKKQNVFDDFIAAAEYLIKNKYTSTDKLAIEGGSNGGLLVGACMTQRPDLYKVALPAVGVMDMLRYHNFTIGYYWAPDYGTSADSIQFQNLYKYSPLHNVHAATKYPATLITTADHDDRVVPAHSFKFAAEMQSKQAGDAPILIRIETKAGHGAGKSTEKMIDEYTDIWSFVFYNMGITPFYN